MSLPYKKYIYNTITKAKTFRSILKYQGVKKSATFISPATASYYRFLQIEKIKEIDTSFECINSITTYDQFLADFNEEKKNKIHYLDKPEQIKELFSEEEIKTLFAKEQSRLKMVDENKQKWNARISDISYHEIRMRFLQLVNTFKSIRTNKVKFIKREDATSNSIFIYQLNEEKDVDKWLSVTFLIAHRRNNRINYFTAREIQSNCNSEYVIIIDEYYENFVIMPIKEIKDQTTKTLQFSSDLNAKCQYKKFIKPYDVFSTELEHILSNNKYLAVFDENKFNYENNYLTSKMYIGDQSEERVFELLKTIPEITHVNKIGSYASHIDIMYKLNYLDVFYEVQVKTIYDHYQDAGKFHIGDIGSCNLDTLVIGIYPGKYNNPESLKKQDLCFFITQRELLKISDSKVTSKITFTIGNNLMYSNNIFLGKKKIFEELKKRIIGNKAICDLDTMPKYPKIALEFISINRQKMIFNELKIPYEEYHTRYSSIDLIINGFSTQLKYSTNMSSDDSMSFHLSKNTNMCYQLGDCDYYLFEGYVKSKDIHYTWIFSEFELYNQGFIEDHNHFFTGQQVITCYFNNSDKKNQLRWTMDGLNKHKEYFSTPKPNPVKNRECVWSRDPIQDQMKALTII